jgi:hypothetical protein
MTAAGRFRVPLSVMMFPQLVLGDLAERKTISKFGEQEIEFESTGYLGGSWAQRNPRGPYR